MAIAFDDNYPEVGALIGFGQNDMDAQSELRGPQSMSEALKHEGRRLNLFSEGKILVNKVGEATVMLNAKTAAKFEPDTENAILMGYDQQGPVIAAECAFGENPSAEPFVLYDMRSLLYSSSIPDQEASVAARAASLVHWNRMNRYCGRCGEPSQTEIGGYRRKCNHCESTIFPRTDPVVIMLIIQGDRCLLGRSPHFPEGWYSTLAGFVEPGETIEAAVRRETLEESGIQVKRVRYHASQPWPFPHSLMIGAFGEAVSQQIDFDSNELEDCQWFTREETRLMIGDTHPKGYKCPPTKAISHALIRHWVTG